MKQVYESRSPTGQPGALFAGAETPPFSAVIHNLRCQDGVTEALGRRAWCCHSLRHPAFKHGGFFCCRRVDFTPADLGFDAL
jgi:hypothetical protein